MPVNGVTGGTTGSTLGSRSGSTGVVVTTFLTSIVKLKLDPT